MRRRHTLAILLAGALAACDASTGPEPYSAEGTWSGQATYGATIVTLTLDQAGQTVTGTGTVAGTQVIAVTAEGQAVEADFALTLSAPGYESMQMIGGFTARNEIEAYMAGSGFFGDQIRLHRQ